MEFVHQQNDYNIVNKPKKSPTNLPRTLIKDAMENLTHQLIMKGNPTNDLLK